MKYKLVLKDMSKPLSEAKSFLMKHKNSFAEHFTKIVVFKNTTNDLDGWISTLSIICDTVGNITVTPKAKKLKEQDYRNIFFSSIESSTDIRLEYNDIILEWSKKNKKLIDINKPSKEEFELYFKMYNELKEELISLFTKKEEYDDNYYKEKLVNFFNNNLQGE